MRTHYNESLFYALSHLFPEITLQKARFKKIHQQQNLPTYKDPATFAVNKPQSITKLAVFNPNRFKDTHNWSLDLIQALNITIETTADLKKLLTTPLPTKGNYEAQLRSNFLIF